MAAFFLYGLSIAAIPSLGMTSTLPANSPSIVIEKSRQPDIKKLSESPTWRALVHASKGRLWIRQSNASDMAIGDALEYELRRTIRNFWDDGLSAACRYPARYLWLARHVHLPALPIETCGEYGELLRRAPAERVYLVFASENLSQPASMMGHVFLRLEGHNERGQPVDHAVSFITDTSGINIPKLLFDSMVLGMPGYFTLSPYQERLHQYLTVDQRSIWELELRITPDRRELLLAHLIELKHSNLTYFFQHYNCATVVDFILTLGTGNELPEEGFWLTPKDVVKRAIARDIVISTTVKPPNKWVVRALGEQLAARDRKKIAWHVEHMLPLAGELNSDVRNNLLNLELARAYHGLRMEAGKASGDRAREYADYLSNERALRSDANIESDAYKDPAKTPQDSQIAFGWSRADVRDRLRIELTPTSHHLTDDNRQYLSETELLLFHAAILLNDRQRRIDLDRLVIYSTKSLTPWDSLAGGLSGAFKLAIEKQLSTNGIEQKAALIHGAIGATWRASADLDFFALQGIGLGLRPGHSKAYLEPEVGMVMRAIFDTKITAISSLRIDLDESTKRRRNHRIHIAHYLSGQRFSVYLLGEKQSANGTRRSTAEVGIKHFF